MVPVAEKQRRSGSGSAARGKGIKPVIGVDAWITNDDNRDRPSRLLLLAKNHTGYLQSRFS